MRYRAGIVLGFLFACLATAAAQEDRSVVLSYMSEDAPTIDGEMTEGEWDAAGPWINVTESSPNARAALGLIAGDDWGGDADISFRFRSMWQKETANFFLIYEVFDDIAMSADPTNLWERDQIETFIDGTNLDGDDDVNSFHWWDNAETYGKLGVSRVNTFEGNGNKMTDDEGVWDEGFNPDVISLSAVKDLETNADYRIELAVSLLPMIDDANTIPFFDTPTEEAGHIVADSTKIKFTAAVSDDDNFSGGGTERSNVITYYRELNGEEAPWDQSTAFADLTFTGEFDGVLELPGDCNGDGVVNPADLDACMSTELLNESLAAQGLLAGDFDADGEVAFGDFLLLSNSFGQEVSYSQGNADGVGAVEFGDFLILSNNFGQTAAAAAVPEPSTFLSVALALTGWCVLRRRRR